MLQDPRAQPLLERYGRPIVARVLRRLLDEARAQAAAGDGSAARALGDSLLPGLARSLETDSVPSLVRVINATGVVVHTNLGRAPLSRHAARRMATIASNYSNLEYDLETGQRGERETHAQTRLVRLLGAEATAVVNNCAAAVLLAINTFAEGRDVLVSRGELVEIGGSFRIPEILGKGGGRLVEVGTTNRTRLADYRAALSPRTGLILKVHRSNFDVVGFTEETGRAELAALGREAGVPVLEDLGSGLLAPPDASMRDEPTVGACLKAGVDVVAFSGDKLLGGPQAGILAGRRALVEALRKNPLYRALRVDKMTLAALDAVLADHDSGRATENVPVLRMLAQDRAALRARAETLAEAIAAAAPALRVEAVPGRSAVGGGAAPSLEIPTSVVSVVHKHLGPDALADALRAGDPPVIARIAEGRVILDVRTLLPGEEQELVAALGRLGAPPAR